MNVNIEELKRKAEAVINCADAVEAVHAAMAFMEAIDPAVTLSLIAEIERLTAMCEIHKRHHADAVAAHKVQRDACQQQHGELVSALERIVDLCNSDGLWCNYDEVIHAEAVLERVYQSSRKVEG